MKAELSVVVPVYNHEAFVESTIESVFEQTFEPIELVIVDDASTDRSVEVVKDLLSRRDVRERFSSGITMEVNTGNLGAHATINYGIGLAAAARVAILNSDDRFGERRCELLISAIEDAGSRLGFGRVETIDETGERRVFSNAPFRIDQLQGGFSDFPEVGWGLIDANRAISSGNLLFEKSLWVELGGFRKYRYCHDWDFVLRSVLKSEPVFEPEAVYDYRIHSSNTLAEVKGLPDWEGPFIVGAFLGAVWSGDFENPRVLAPQTWPGVFEHYITSLQLDWLWQRVCSRPTELG